MRFAARFLLAFVVLFSFFFFTIPSSVNAQIINSQTTNPYLTPNTDTAVPANMHTYTQSVVLEVLSAFTCQITGVDPLSASHECLGYNTATGKIGYETSNGGAIGFMGTMIGYLYTPPINTVKYVQSVASNFGLVKRADASSFLNGCSTSGCGFDQLSPLVTLWTTFRNLAYLLFIIVFIAIGFAIMLRVKIDPRTVMTIENQIPKIIVALLLVTFSYAIAGFLIDMMYVTTYLTINVVANSQGVTPNTKTAIHNAEKNLQGGTPFGFADYVTGNTGSAGQGGGGLFGITFNSSLSIGTLVQHLIVDMINSSNLGHTTSNFNSNVEGAVVNGLGWLIAGIAGILAFFVIGISLLVALFRLWFSLLIAYVSLLLDIIFGPFIIVMGIFPGSKMGFGSWFRSIVGNLLAFPVAVAMFLLAAALMWNFAESNPNVFVPPLIGNPGGISNINPISYLIALGIILITPNVVSMTKGLVGAPESKVLPSIFQGIGVGGKATSGALKQGLGALFGQEIEYDNSGAIKPLNNPVSRFWRGFVRRTSG